MQLFIKPSDNNRYPITADQIKQENPGISFPQYISNEDAIYIGYFPVKDIRPNYDEKIEVLQEKDPIFSNNEWVRQWDICLLPAVES